MGTEEQTSWNQEAATITVRSSMYRGQDQHRVKTQAALREVDIEPRLNTAIVRFVAEQNIQPGVFLFQSTSGRAMHLRTATARLKKRAIPGFHSFRRFWTTRRRDIGVPEDIIRFWLGHAGHDITDRYSKLAENVELRKEWARRAGLGFELLTSPRYVASDEDLSPIFFEEPTPSPTQEEIDAEFARLAELRAILEGVN
jgi:hypothetical protein